MRRWIITLVGVSTIPPIFYLCQFGFGLWDKNEDWAHLGSFFGGVLGPAFTFMSVLLLVETLEETRKSNKKQLALVHKQHFDNLFFNSLTAIKMSLKSPKYGCEIKDSHPCDFFSEADDWVVKNFKISGDRDLYEDAWETAKNYIRKHPRVFDSEVSLLVPILIKIKELPDDEKCQYLTLIKGLIENNQRFWLEVYGLVWSLELQFSLQDIDFSILPQTIQNKIFELEDRN